MAQKLDDYESEETEDEKQKDHRFHLDKITIFTAISFIILCDAFLYLLSVKTSEPFGIVQILFSIMSGAVMALFLVWTRFIMTTNRFMGAFLSIAGIVATSYALTRKYQGGYTTTFLIMGIVIALAYTIYYFIRFGKKN